MTHDEAYEEALRRITEARRQRAKTLDLSHLLGARIPPELFELEWLESLTISTRIGFEYEALTQLPSDFRNLKSLRALDISWHSIADLSPLKDLAQLQTLDCSHNQVADLSPLKGLAQLQKLDCSRNQVDNLSPLKDLTQLQTLDCSGNQIDDLSPLKDLAKLQVLYCGSNKVTDLFPLKDLAKLERLDCSSNKVDLFPLKDLAKLQTLDCSGNQIDNLSPLKDLTQLQTLDCSGNQIDNLSHLQGLTQLQTLYCRGNQVDNLSPLKDLTQLQTLDCSGNQIDDLSPLKDLAKLQVLYCGSNKVTDLFPLKDLAKLERLDCSSNLVADLEPVRPAICSGQIKKFNCYGNPVHGLPAELLVPNMLVPNMFGSNMFGSNMLDNIAEALRGYWLELAQGGEPNRDVKIILVGNGCVGKTTLAYGLLHRSRPPAGIAERTHGIVTKELPLELPTGERLRVRLWDCGGQELYHATHRLFLHHDALYLLLWAEETDEAPEEPRHPVSYWLGHIRELAGESPVILVKNQIDRSDRYDPPEFQDQSSSFVQHLKISALNYTGMDALWGAIKDILGQLRLRWGYYQLPTSWLRVRDDLAKRLEEKTLSHEEYRRLCKQHGVQYPDFLLAYLHKSGFLFYHPGRFGNDLFLDQNWIINIVYRLFDPAKGIRNRLCRQKGNFTGADTQDFWHEYNEAERKVFLDYLLGCEMIFALNERWSMPFAEQQFVLPAMLPQEPPPGVKGYRESSRKDEWWLDFSYRFLHRGLIERLIVRTAHLSLEQDWWRDGILLQDPDSQCWLLLDYQPNSSFKNAKNTIRLRIGGGQNEQKARARDKMQNLLQELHPQNPPTIFVSPNDKHFVSLEEVEKGKSQVITRAGEIVDDTDYQVFRQTVDPEQRFERPAPSEALVRIFISSSSKDIEYRKRLKKCIKAIEGILSIPIDCWDDSHIRSGEWETQIYSKLIKANIICLLISADFFASDVCRKEANEALKQHQHRKSEIIPILIEEVDGWDKHPLGKLQTYPKDNGKLVPVADWKVRDKAWNAVQKGIRKTVKEILQQRNKRN